MNKRNFLGVTFIELLIGLTIFSIVAASLYSTFFSSTSAWKKSEDLNRLYQEARWSLDTIAKELHNAIIFSYKKSYPDFKVFAGAADSLSFLLEDEYGIKRVIYFLEAQADDDEISVFFLKRQESSLVDSLQLAQEEKSLETLSSLVSKEGLKFSYAYSSGEGEDAQIEWQDKWQDSDNLPAGVRIELVLQNANNPSSKASFNKTVFIPIGIIGEDQERK